jgi:hypothetical protein
MSSNHRQWSIAEFERERSHLCDWLKSTVVRAIEEGKRRILVRAPVKSGKRQMVEYLAMRDNTHNPTRKHTFLTAWHRTADEEQRAELKCYGIDVFSGITGKKKDDYNNKIRVTIQSAPKVKLIIHIDECDHGTAELQVLADIWREWRDNTNVVFILYSATPEEVIYSGEIDSEHEEMMGDLIEGEDECEGARFDYTPVETFCGPAKFLDEKLVVEARPFFEKVVDIDIGAPHRYRLTQQGRQLIDELREQMKVDRKRNILMLRLSYDTEDNDTIKPNTKKEPKESKKAIHQFLKNLHMFAELTDCQVYVDKDEKPPGMSKLCEAQKIGWSRATYWRGITTEYPVIIVNDQTCSRSTELAVHDRIFAYHDYRRTITFTVCSQAFERPNHYSTKYPSGFQRIRIYCHMKTMLLSAGRISYEEYIKKPEWTMKKQYNSDMYQIVKNDRTRSVHRDHPTPMTQSKATNVLLDLGCDKTYTKLSARVTGKIDDEIVIQSVFVPCSSADEFDNLRRQGALNGKDGRGPRDNLFDKYSTNPENPAEPQQQQFECNIRSERKVRTVEEVKHEHWGISQRHQTRRHICYNDEDGVCGVLIQMFDGYREVDTLTNRNSMYRPKQKRYSEAASRAAADTSSENGHDTNTDTDTD